MFYFSEIIPEDKALLENELEACRALTHKNLVQVLSCFAVMIFENQRKLFRLQVKEIFHDDKFIIIVMEYFDGGDLLAYVNTVRGHLALSLLFSSPSFFCHVPNLNTNERTHSVL